ncbi:MAG: hypothetical protein M0P52_10560 [Rhodoferax sp.]|jgi:hypothetical protein|nr:hypothetical protein [Rhodoferax sp.]
MAQSGQRKCLNCAEFFTPDHRNRTRQHYCTQPECRKASKTAAQAAWLAKPANQDYWRDPSHVARVQAWRAAHPGYSRKGPKAAVALQDPLPAQAIDSIEETVNRGAIPELPALQDAFTPASPILTGLIAHLFSVTLQDDIDQVTRRLIQLGNDINRRSHHEDHQISASP